MKREKTPDFVAGVRRTISRYGMTRPGETVLVACSGGADSTALLHVLNDLRGDLSIRLAVAHFDHGLRAASARDARFVHEMAAELGLPFYLEKRDVKSYALEHGLNIEEAGRRVRYEFLRETAAEIGAARVATGHSLDDQAESVLMRLLRGSGSRGLGGIAPVLEYVVIRPLIEVRRAEVEAFLKSRRIAHREDESNRDLRFLRNAVRRRLIPHLEKHYEPAIVEKLGRTADVLSAEDRALELHVQRILPGMLSGKGLKTGLSVDALAVLPVGLSRRCIRSFIEIQKGDLLRVTFLDIENIRALKPGKMAILPGGIRLMREGPWIKRAPGRPVRKAAGFHYRWTGKSALKIPQARAVFTVRIGAAGRDETPSFDDSRRAFLDADRIVLPLTVRSPKAGDRFRPLGAPGRQKLTELMRERGIPVSDRGRKAVFESEGKIIWVEGLPVAEDFKIGPATRRTIVIEKS